MMSGSKLRTPATHRVHLNSKMPPKAKAEVKSDEVYVSLTHVNELMQQQKEMFVALLEQQHDNFKGFVKIIMDSTNNRLDAITKDLQDIKTSLQFTQKDVDDIKSDIAKQSKRCNAMQSDIFKFVTVYLLSRTKWSIWRENPGAIT